MNRPFGKQKKAEKLKKGDEVFALGKFGRVIGVHTHNDNTTVHVKTFTMTNPQRFSVIIDRNVLVRFRPKAKKK